MNQNNYMNQLHHNLFKNINSDVANLYTALCLSSKQPLKD